MKKMKEIQFYSVPFRNFVTYDAILFIYVFLFFKYESDQYIELRGYISLLSLRKITHSWNSLFYS